MPRVPCDGPYPSPRIEGVVLGSLGLGGVRHVPQVLAAGSIGGRAAGGLTRTPEGDEAAGSRQTTPASDKSCEQRCWFLKTLPG